MPDLQIELPRTFEVQPQILPEWLRPCIEIRRCFRTELQVNRHLPESLVFFLPSAHVYVNLRVDGFRNLFNETDPLGALPMVFV